MRHAAIAAAALTTVAIGGCGDEPKPQGTLKTKPQRTLKIYSSLPEHGISASLGRSTKDGAEIALTEHDGRVGRFRILYKKLDDTPGHGLAKPRVGKRNARRVARDKRTIAYLGDYNSSVSKVSIPILNRAGIAQLSSSNTYVGLTVDAPGAERGDPERYYPTRRRTYARIMPNDLVQAGALAKMAKAEGCREVHVLWERSSYGRGLGFNVLRASAKLGMDTRENSYDPRAPDYEARAASVRAPCAIVAGEMPAGGRMLAALAAKGGSRLRVYGVDGVCSDASSDPTTGVPHSLANRYECAIATLETNGFGPRGQRVVSAYEREFGGPAAPGVVYGYEAMSLLLDAIDRARGDDDVITRRGVVDALLATKNRQSPIGTYSIDPNGDTTLTSIGAYRIVAARLALDHVVQGFRP